jgi:Zn-dependent peptidase ImmA (M78 family)
MIAKNVKGAKSGCWCTPSVQAKISKVECHNPVIYPLYSAEAQSNHTIAHELGHILMHTIDEDKAEKKARELLSGRQVAKAP